MISYLEGTLLSIRDTVLVINVGGVGYRVFTSIDTRSKLPALGSVCRLHIHTHVREDALDLYGFLVESHLQFFELLLSVSGVGPKLAMNICGTSSISRLQQAIVANDPSAFKGIRGVGKRTAERLIIDLREKVAALGVKASPVAGGAPDTQAILEALKTMGYNDVVAHDALTHVHGSTIEEKLTAALQYLGKRP